MGGKGSGRKSGYTNAIAERICRRIANGESLKKILEDPGMPDKDTIFRWLKRYPFFSDSYALARRNQAAGYIDEIADLADNCDCESAADVAKRRLQIDTRKWIACKVIPKTYGDKTSLAVEGSLSISHSLDLSSLSDEQINALNEALCKPDSKK